MSEDIVARITEAIGCQFCGKALRPNGPSPDFCSEPCQGAWQAKYAGKQWPASDDFARAPSHGWGAADVTDWQRAFMASAPFQLYPWSRQPEPPSLADAVDEPLTSRGQGRGFTADYVNIDELEIADLYRVPPAQLRTEPIKLTREQFDLIPSRPPGYFHSGSIAEYAGVPVELVDTFEESTPYIEGWTTTEPSPDVDRAALLDPPTPQDRERGWLSRLFERWNR